MKNRITGKANIEYPCIWLYKVIGKDRNKIEKALKQAFKGQKIEMQFSNISNKGSYLAFNIEIEVRSEKQRDDLYSILKAHPDIKAVL